MKYEPPSSLTLHGLLTRKPDKMPDSGSSGLIRIIKAAGFSWAGIKAAYKNEAAFRQETWLAIVLIPLAIWLAENTVQMALMISSVILVMLVEILNSAIEAVVDRFGGDQHPLSGRAKDMASALFYWH